MTLTKKDKENIGEIVGKTIAENNEILFEHFTSKAELKELDEKMDTKFHELKSELINELQKTEDVLVKEIKDSRDERLVMSHQVSRNTHRIEKLETAVFKN